MFSALNKRKDRWIEKKQHYKSLLAICAKHSYRDVLFIPNFVALPIKDKFFLLFTSSQCTSICTRCAWVSSASSDRSTPHIQARSRTRHCYYDSTLSPWNVHIKKVRPHSREVLSIRQNRSAGIWYSFFPTQHVHILAKCPATLSNFAAVWSKHMKLCWQCMKTCLVAPMASLSHSLLEGKCHSAND